MAVKRPVLRYHGGKWLMAPWIIQHMPKHKVYVEAFGGGGSVLLRKDRVSAEVYNDLDGLVVNIFRILQDPAKADQVCRRLSLTPYARSEFDRTYTEPADEIEWACFMIMRSFMGHGTDSIGRTCRTGFRGKMTDNRALPSEAWASWPRSVAEFVDRLRGVVIENRQATEVILRMDTASTLFYVDPPYVSSTRSSLDGGRGASHGYRCELTDDDHVALAEVLSGVKGMVMLSGYSSPLYDELYGDWFRLERQSMADGARVRTECLWFNAAAERRRPQRGLALVQEMVG